MRFTGFAKYIKPYLGFVLAAPVCMLFLSFPLSFFPVSPGFVQCMHGLKRTDNC